MKKGKTGKFSDGMLSHLMFINDIHKKLSKGGLEWIQSSQHLFDVDVLKLSFINGGQHHLKAFLLLHVFYWIKFIVVMNWFIVKIFHITSLVALFSVLIGIVSSSLFALAYCVLFLFIHWIKQNRVSWTDAKELCSALSFVGRTINLCWVESWRVCGRCILLNLVAYKPRHGNYRFAKREVAPSTNWNWMCSRSKL